MHQITDVTDVIYEQFCYGFDGWFRSYQNKTNILVKQTRLSSRLTSNRHVGRTVTDKSRVIHQKNAKFCPSAQHEDQFSSFGE